MNEKSLSEARHIIADYLKKRRIALNISQKELADMSGISYGTINRLENGHFWLVMKQFVIICNALQLLPSISPIETDSNFAELFREKWVNGWISVEDSLPEDYSWVLVSLKSPHDIWVEMAGFSNGFFLLPGRDTTNFVTHWMPLPSPATLRKSRP